MVLVNKEYEFIKAFNYSRQNIFNIATINNLRRE